VQLRTNSILCDSAQKRWLARTRFLKSQRPKIERPKIERPKMQRPKSQNTKPSGQKPSGQNLEFQKTGCNKINLSAHHSLSVRQSNCFVVRRINNFVAVIAGERAQVVRRLAPGAARTGKPVVRQNHAVIVQASGQANRAALAVRRFREL
jgi:hypothetical protein